MVLFRHALRICTIACIFVASEGHVLLAVNVEDFRNIANQFLSKNLAQKLSHLVSDTAKANRRDDSKGDSVPDIDLNKVAELIRDRIMKDYKTTVPSTKNTRNPNNKRFNTVQNTVDTTESAKLTKRILRDPNYESPGLVYVKDDVQTQFQNYDEQPNKYDTIKPDYFETKLKESDEKIISQEPTNAEGSLYVKENTEHQGDTHKKMDYTETKLGEWLYNHIMAQKPSKLQNHKTGNMDINDEGNADELPDESENIKKIQYVYSLSDQDKSKQNIENVPEIQPNKYTNNFNLQYQQTDSTNNDYIMGPKLNSIYNKKPQKQLIDENYSGSQTKRQEIENQVMDKRDYVKPIQGNKNALNEESIALDQDQQTDEQDTINESIMRPKQNAIYKNKPQKQQVEENYSGPQIKHHEKQVMDKRNYVRQIQGYKNAFNQESIAFDQGQKTGQQGTIKESIMRPKQNTIYKNIPQKQRIEEIYTSSQVKDKEIENLHLEDRPEFLKPIRGNKKTFNNENNDLDQGEGRMPANLEETKPEPIKAKIESYDAEDGKQKPIEKHTMYDKYVLESKEKEENQKEPQRQLVRENYELGKDAKNRNDNRVDPQEVDNSGETFMLQIQKVFNGNKYKADYSTHDQLLLRNKKMEYENQNQNLSNKKVKSESVKSKIESSLDDTVEVKDKEEERHIMPTKEYNIQRKKPQKESLEENDMHETYALSSETKYKKHKNVEPLSDDDYVPRKPPGIKHRYDNVSGKNDEFSIKKQSLFKTAKPSSVTVAKHDLTTKALMKKDTFVEDSLLGLDSAKLGSFSDEIKDKKVKQHDTSNKYESVHHKETFKKQKMEENDMYDTKSNKYKHKETFEKQEMAENDMYDTKSNKYKHKEVSKKQEVDENDMYDTKSIKYKHKEASNKQEMEENDMYDTKTNKNNHKETSEKQKNDENDMYDTKSNKYKRKEASKKEEMEENDMYDTKTNKYKHKETSEKQEMDENGMNDTKSNKYKRKEASKKQEMRENDTDEKYSLDRKNKDKTKLRKQPIEQNDMYEIYSLGSKNKGKDRELKKDDDNYGYEDTVLGRGKINKGHRDRDKDDTDNNDELILKNKNRYLLKATNTVKGLNNEEVPSEGYAGDPRPDYREVKPEHIKAKTDRLIDSAERKERSTKRFRMKGTLIPKREFYKLSSPNYYKDLPRTVDKYDFSEPIPERDRERDKVRYLKREPARVNRKLKLPKYERIT